MFNHPKEKIPVTKPFFPPLEEYQSYLSGIWEKEYITNNGPLVQELEVKLNKRLGTQNMVFVSNGTIALQIAIKALQLEGEIITTPFSYVATTSSIVWEGCTPVFVDIDEQTLNIDPKLIESAITDKTCAILATHVFGNPCDVESIQKIADKYNLKVIYDAAHCFGVTYKDQSIFNYGDVSTTSFHATKLYHTVEGGGIFTSDENVKKRVQFMRNFGHDGPGNFNGIGINGKNSEVHAAMGLCNLNYVEKILKTRKQQSEIYDELLLKNIYLSKQKIIKDANYNYAYYPIIFKNENLLLESISNLEVNGINPRRYFYPSLTELSYVKGDCPISKSISRKILCLPLFDDLKYEQQLIISELLNNRYNNVSGWSW